MTDFQKMKDPVIIDIAKLTSDLRDLSLTHNSSVSRLSEAISLAGDIDQLWKDEYQTRHIDDVIENLNPVFPTSQNCEPVNASPYFLKAIVSWKLPESDLKKILENVPVQHRDELTNCVNTFLEYSETEITGVIGNLS